MIATPTQLAYLAGVIDSDGFISIHRGHRTTRIYHQLVAGIAGTRREPHDLAASLFGGGITEHQPKNARHRKQFVWNVYGPKAAEFIAAIAPYLLVKRGQAGIAAEFHKLAKDHPRGKPIEDDSRHEREGMWERMVDLNQPRNRRPRGQA